MLLLLAAMLAGCTSQTPRPPPVFAIDEVRHWFEGDLLVVNVTFTNVANFTPGLSTGIEPSIWGGVHEWRAKAEPSSRRGDDLELLPRNFSSTRLYFSPSRDVSWQDRWYDDRTAGLLGLGRTLGDVGPVVIPPGVTVSVEFGFLPHNRFRGDEGFYVVELDPYANYPDGYVDITIPESNRFLTGCFNLDTPAFYGVREDGPDCHYWDNTGEWTQVGVGMGEKRCPPPREPRRPPPDPAKPGGC